MSDEDPIDHFKRMRQAMQPTEAEIAEMKARRIKQDAEDERMFSTALPHLYAARDSLREAWGVGVGGDYFRRAQKNLAILIENLELELRRPPIK
jgi:hypothetical protein